MMSESHTRRLLNEYLPNCPICKKMGDYIISPAFTIAQCESCKAKYFSEDFKNLESELEELMLSSLPSKRVNENIILILNSMKLKYYNISFWKNLDLNIMRAQVDNYEKNRKKLNMERESRKQYDTDGEKTILTLTREFKAIRHGEHLEVSKWFLRFDLSRDLRLTNKRLLFLRDNKITYEIPINNIKEAYRDAALSGNPIIKLDLKNGSRISIVFAPFTKTSIIRFAAIGVYNLPHFLEKSRSEVDRWLRAINDARELEEVENGALEIAQKRLARGEISIEEYEELKKRLE